MELHYSGILFNSVQQIEVRNRFDIIIKNCPHSYKYDANSKSDYKM